MYVSVQEKLSVEISGLIHSFFISITKFQSMQIFKTMTITGTMENKKKFHIINVYDVCMFKCTVS